MFRILETLNFYPCSQMILNYHNEAYTCTYVSTHLRKLRELPLLCYIQTVPNEVSFLPLAWEGDKHIVEISFLQNSFENSVDPDQLTSSEAS